MKEHETISQTELIDYLGVEPAAISKTLTKLEKKHIIERHYIKACRGKHIFLTDEGRRLYEPLEDVVTLHRQKALEDFSSEERQQLFMFMRRIYHNVLE